MVKENPDSIPCGERTPYGDNSSRGISPLAYENSIRLHRRKINEKIWNPRINASFLPLGWASEWMILAWLRCGSGLRFDLREGAFQAFGQRIRQNAL
jgi:hypothetical protein